jgi:hypothetical protein
MMCWIGRLFAGKDIFEEVFKKQIVISRRLLRRLLQILIKNHLWIKKQ